MHKQKEILYLFLRYVIIFLAGLGNLWIFYKLFTLPTLYVVSFVFSIFTQSSVIGNSIVLSFVNITLIPACIAGAAYYLLFILLFATPRIGLKQRVLALLFMFASLLVLNSARIITLALINKAAYFESIHLIFWYAVSTVFVVIVWLLTVKIFKIRKIPIYNDVRYLLSFTKSRKKPKRKR